MSLRRRRRKATCWGPEPPQLKVDLSLTPLKLETIELTTSGKSDMAGTQTTSARTHHERLDKMRHAAHDHLPTSCLRGDMKVKKVGPSRGWTRDLSCIRTHTDSDKSCNEVLRFAQPRRPSSRNFCARGALKIFGDFAFFSRELGAKFT